MATLYEEWLRRRQAGMIPQAPLPVNVAGYAPPRVDPSRMYPSGSQQAYALAQPGQADPLQISNPQAGNWAARYQAAEAAANTILQDERVRALASMVGSPGIDYAGGGSGVVANDINGQFGPVVLPQPDPNVNRMRGFAGTNQVPERAPFVPNVSADQAKINQVASGMTEGDSLLNEAGDAASAVADSAVGKGVGWIIEQYNRGYNWNVKQVGEDMIDRANGKEGQLNPYFYVDSGVELWSSDPRNKDRINTIATNGLDLNGDGTIDVRGGEAVYMVYNAEIHGGFFDNLMTATAMDPLFAASFVGPAASAARAGAGTAAEMSLMAGLSRQARVLRAAEKALAGAEKIGEYGNIVQDAPLTVPVAAAKAVTGRAGELIPAIRRGVGFFSDPASGTVERNLRNTAADAADIAQAAAPMPNYRGDYQYTPSLDGTPMLPAGPEGTSPMGPFPATTPDYGPISQPSVGAGTPQLPASSAYPDFEVGPGGQPVPRTPQPTMTPYPETTPPAPIVVDVPVSRSNARGVPTTTIGLNKDVRVVARDGGVWELQVKERNRWVGKQGFTDEAEAIDAGKDLVRQTLPQPESAITTEALPEPVAADPVTPDVPETPQRPTLPTEGMTREQRNAAIANGQISQLTPVPGGPRLIDQAWDKGLDNPEAWARFVDEYKPKAEAYKSNAAYIESKYYSEFNQKKTDQVVGGIEHTVDDVAPAYLNAYGELPEPVPMGRKQANTKSGKARYDQENPEYLYQRYVYTSNEKDAAKIMEVLRARPDLKNASWLDYTLDRLRGARERLQTLRQQIERDNTITGIRPPGSEMLDSLNLNEVTAPRVPADPNWGPIDAEASSRFNMTDEIDAQAARGAIPRDVVPDLKTKIRVPSVRRNNRWEAATFAEVEKRMGRAAETLPATGTYTGKSVRVEEITWFDLMQRTAQEMPNATAGEISQAFADKVVDLSGVRVPYNVRRGPIVDAIRDINRVGRSGALYNWATGVRGITSDMASDAFRMALDGHLDAAIKAMTPVDYVKALRGSKSEAVTIAERYGQDIPNEIRVKKGRVEIDAPADGRTPTNEVISRRLGLKQGGIGDKAVAILTEPLDSKYIREGRNASDNIRREAVFVSEINKREMAMARDFRAKGRAWAEENGILASSFDAYVADLGQRFTSEELRSAMTELATDAGLRGDRAVNFASRMTRDWQNDVRKMFKAADAEQKRVLFSYQRTKVDEALGQVTFYHYWMTRAIPAYARIALRNPEIAAMWIRAWQDAETRAREQGLPDSMLGTLRFFGSAAGFYGAGNVWNVLLPLADMRPDAQAQGWWEQATQFLMVNPIIQAAASVAGLSDDVVDPLMTYAVRNLGLAIVNEIRARRGLGPTRDPIENLLRNAYEIANDLASRASGGALDEKQFYDPMTGTTSTIRYVVASVVEEQTGIPKEQWTETEYQLWWNAVKDGESGITGDENPIYQEGFQRWADANLKGRIATGVVPGGIRTRYGPRDYYMNLEYDQMTPGQKDAQQMLNTGSVESGDLTMQKRGYDAIGTTRQQDLADGWRTIAFSDIDSAELIVVNGRYYDRAELERMTDKQRYALADQWVAEHGGADELKAYRTERDAFVTANPALARYEKYKDDISKSPLGEAEWVAVTRKGNANFDRYLTDQEGRGKAAVDAAFTPGGYLAWAGKKDSIYSDPPISINDPTKIPFSATTSTASSGSSGGTSEPADDVTKLADMDAQYQADLATIKAYLPSGIAWEDMAPVQQKAYAAELKRRGIEIPDMPSKLSNYYAWKTLNAGSDTSYAAYIKWRDKVMAEQEKAAA